LPHLRRIGDVLSDRYNFKVPKRRPWNPYSLSTSDCRVSRILLNIMPVGKRYFAKVFGSFRMSVFARGGLIDVVPLSSRCVPWLPLSRSLLAGEAAWAGAGLGIEMQDFKFRTRSARRLWAVLFGSTALLAVLLSNPAQADGGAGGAGSAGASSGGGPVAVGGDGGGDGQPGGTGSDVDNSAFGGGGGGGGGAGGGHGGRGELAARRDLAFPLQAVPLAIPALGPIPTS